MIFRSIEANRNAGRDFHPNEKAGNFQAIDHGARSLAARDHQPVHAGLHKALGNVGHRLLDRMASGIAAVTRLEGGDLVGGRA